MSNDENVRYTLPPGGLLGRPLKGNYKLKIWACKNDGRSAIPLAVLLKNPQAKEPNLTFQSEFDGQIRAIPVPDGSIEAYITKRPSEFGGTDVYVTWKFEYEPAPGEDITVPQDRIPQEVKDYLKKLQAKHQAS